MIMDLWKHKALVHGVAYSDEILLYVLTEQNFELDKKVRQLEDATRENTAEVRKLVDNLQLNHKVEKPVQLNNPFKVNEYNTKRVPSVL